MKINHSPYEQNQYHINILSEKLGLERKNFKSIIVLGYNTKKDIKTKYDDCEIINIQELLDYIINDILNSEDIFTHEQIDNIYMNLKYNK